MINDDTFVALAHLWDDRIQEIFATQTRHFDRCMDAADAVVRGEMTETDGKAAARRSLRLHEDRLEFLGRYYVGKISDELAAWMRED